MIHHDFPPAEGQGLAGSAPDDTGNATSEPECLSQCQNPLETHAAETRQNTENIALKNQKHLKNVYYI